MFKTKADVTVNFDHHCPVSRRDPDEAYVELMNTCPVAWTAAHGGYWVVTRYDEVFRILRDYRNFSSRDGMAIPAHGHDYRVPVALDPPEHVRYRRAMNPYMSREAVRDILLPRVKHWTTHYIDRVIEKGACDFAYDLAVPIPGAITLEWVGWDAREEWDHISEMWHDLLAYPLDHPRTKRSHEGISWFTGRIAEELEKRRKAPRDDIISFVAHLEIDGKPIAQQDAVSMVTIWVAGGVDTTTTFILGGLLHLHRNPDHRRRLIQEPHLWDSAMEEILRRYPPTRTTTRTVVNEVEVGGCRMNPGDRILVSLSGANVDPVAFEAPAEVLLDRKQGKEHMAFGMGAHRCVGMHLARQEFRTVVGQILERMPDFKLNEAQMAAYERQSEMRGWTSMPATFTPAARLDATHNATDATSGRRQQMDQSPENVVREYLAAFGKSVAEDHATYRKFLAADVQYYSGTTMVHGSENTVTFSRRGEELLGLASWRAELLNLIVQGDVVVVERVDIQISSEGDEVMRTPILGYFKVKNGQITEWRDYWDPRPLLEYGEKYRARKGVAVKGWGDVPGGAESAAVSARG